MRRITLCIFLIGLMSHSQQAYAELSCGPKESRSDFSVPGIHVNGRVLNSSVLMGISFNRLELNGEQLKDVKLDGTALYAKTPEGRQLKGQAFVGATLAGVDSQYNLIKLKIDSITRDPNDMEVYLYRVKFWNENYRLWADLCPENNNPYRQAIILHGVWEPDGSRQDSSSMFSLSCLDSAIAKCVRWGYKPWKVISGRSLRDFHQACTRMVRADYEGTGETYTRSGTEIFVSDVLGIQKGRLPDGMTLEAAWGTDGAIVVMRPRHRSLLAGFGGPVAPNLKRRNRRVRKQGSRNEILLLNYSFDQ